MSASKAILPIKIGVENIAVAVVWFVAGVVATYMTTTSAEVQISSNAWCSLFSNTHGGMMSVGHCPWCYAAVAAFGASVISLFKKA